MQDVFEPTANFGGEVFEPMNFAGEVFEPMNFDGDYSNFAVLNCGCVAKHPFNKGKRTECINQCNQKKANKKGGANVTDISSLAPAPTPAPAPAPASAPAPVTEPAMQTASTDNVVEEKKILGMSKKTALFVGLGVLAVGITTFFLIRRGK